jgi:hypothetical protein
MTEIAYPTEDRNLIQLSIKHVGPTATLQTFRFFAFKEGTIHLHCTAIIFFSICTTLRTDGEAM